MFMLTVFPHTTAQVFILFEVNQGFDHGQALNDPIP